MAAEGAARVFLDETRIFTLMVIFELIMGEKLTYKQARTLCPALKEFSEGLLTLPIKLPFTRYTRALRARKRVLSYIGKRIDGYMNVVESMSPEEWSKLKLNSAGVYLGGECYLENLIFTYKLNRGVTPSTKYVEENCLGMLFAGVDTSSTSLTTIVALIARE